MFQGTFFGRSDVGISPSMIASVEPTTPSQRLPIDGRGNLRNDGSQHLFRRSFTTSPLAAFDPLRTYRSDVPANPLNCPTTVSGSKSFEQAATGRSFHILRDACGSNRAACQVMIDGAGLTVSRQSMLPPMFHLVHGREDFTTSCTSLA